MIIQLIKENSKKINRSAKSLHFKYFRRIISNCRTRIADLTKSLCWFWIKIIMKSINILVDFFHHIGRKLWPTSPASWTEKSPMAEMDQRSVFYISIFNYFLYCLKILLKKFIFDKIFDFTGDQLKSPECNCISAFYDQFGHDFGHPASNLTV